MQREGINLQCSYFFLLLVFVRGSENEPKCYSRFDYDYKILQKLLQIEQIIATQNETIALLSKLTLWGGWSTWGDCFTDCTGINSGRVQSRSRETIGIAYNVAKRNETESRPCNSVQFAGCIKSSKLEDNYGVTYHYADQMAQATCTAIKTSSGHTSAVRRECSNSIGDCNAVCANLRYQCFNSLHVYQPSVILKTNKNGAEGLKMYRYDTCAHGGCGPNFCCCAS